MPRNDVAAAPWGEWWACNVLENHQPTMEGTWHLPDDQLLIAVDTPVANWSARLWSPQPATLSISACGGTRPDGLGKGDVLHVCITGFGELLQPLWRSLPHARCSAWVYPLRGTVVLGSGRTGMAVADARSRGVGTWQLLTGVNHSSPAEEVFVGSDVEDVTGACFFLAAVSAQPIDRAVWAAFRAARSDSRAAKSVD